LTPVVDRINGQVWRKSRRCETAACVSVAVGREQVWMRDDADPDGPRLTFAAGSWKQFLAGVRAGDFDPR
jgi:hypothetical protein